MKKRYVKTNMKCSRKIEIARMKQEFNKPHGQFDEYKIGDMIRKFCLKYTEIFDDVLSEIAS
ncbi:hypothetical protein [Bacillus thuringiensis]|uniref:hypothetical protein n=1 Tax=Bacillus thuringiensis TaxID=1428 RepID=UPI000BFB6444|nr:hypothetical protein [Bacillus thuringiensis]PGT89814.1 hypothetical protein COD17_08685 [Bacillus thuringiensis]